MRLLASLPLALVAATSIGCAHPLALDEDRVLRQVTANYRSFFPADRDPDPARDAGLLRPRFGLPAIVKAGDPFPVELLRRGAPAAIHAVLVQPGLSDEDAARCASGAAVAGCHPLALTEQGATAVPTDAEHVRLSAQPAAPPPVGPYDLYLASAIDAPVRVPRAVWLRDVDPDTLPSLRIVHMSDLHIGKFPENELAARLRQVIEDVNALAPDLIVITGDVVNFGDDGAMPDKAREILLSMKAPALIVVGNHDHGFGPKPVFGSNYVNGWSNFARTFHPYLHYKVALGGFDFIGFDSGPSVFSPRVLVRGVAPETVAAIGAEIDDAQRAGRRGVVLFSHAPSRASLVAREGSTDPGLVGRMHEGHLEFEQLLLVAAERGQRVLHLAGHTHWSDCFEAHKTDKGFSFARSPLSQLPPCPTPLASRAALITTQAADHSGIPIKDNARGWGFTELLLDGASTRVAFHRYGLGDAATCSAAMRR